MPQPSAETIWHLTPQELIDFLDSKTLIQNRRQIRFYAPSFSYYKNSLYCSSSDVFPTISLTGNSCALNCKHRGRKVLATMKPAVTPEKLYELCSNLKQHDAVGCLISGGCLPDGSVPLKPFTRAIERIKWELGLTVFVHTGIIDKETAVLLKQSKVDAALIDVIGSQETIDKVYGLKASVQDYADSLTALQNADLPFVPHVVVGLNNGKLDGELRALQMIGQTKPAAVVIIAFMPIAGTEMAKVEPPKPHDIARVVSSARVMFSDTPVVLGCMRPKGKFRANVDVLALKAGVDAMAFPSQEATDFA